MTTKQRLVCIGARTGAKQTKECKEESARKIAITCTRGLVAMTSASHAEGRQFDPGQVYDSPNFAYMVSPQTPTG